jgi:hypothetical protein
VFAILADEYCSDLGDSVIGASEYKGRIEVVMGGS